MHKGGFFGFLCTLAWVVPALAALNMGLRALGWFDFFSLNFFMTYPNVRMYTELAVGALGAWSLVGYVKHVVYCGGKCDGSCC